VFGPVISTLLRTAEQDATVSAKNTYRSIKEQTETSSHEEDGLYLAINGEL